MPDETTVGETLAVGDTTGWNIPEADWRKALAAFARKLKRARKTCKHTRWRSFAEHGRCCPSCGTFVVDMGD